MKLPAVCKKVSDTAGFPRIFLNNSRAYQGLSRPDSLKFKDPIWRVWRQGSRLITVVTLRTFIMRTSRLYRRSQATIKKRERCYSNYDDFYTCQIYSSTFNNPYVFMPNFKNL